MGGTDGSGGGGLIVREAESMIRSIGGELWNPLPISILTAD